MRRGWIGVDLDGTLAHYDEWRGAVHIGAPIPAMVARVKRWLAAGLDVRVMTARMSTEDNNERANVLRAVENWTQLHVGRRLHATCVKDYDMVELWDDRCVAVEANTGRPLNKSTRGLED